MCGIFGAISYNKKITSVKFKSWADDLFQLSESRGKEAAGIALLTNNKIHTYKEAVKSSNFIRLNTYQNLFNKTESAHPLAFIGHSRLATNGFQAENHNNQPVANNIGVIVHNGIIVNDQYIWKTILKKKPRFEVDTEVLIELIRHFKDNGADVVQACSRLYKNIEGSASIAALLKFNSELVLATNTGSLYYAWINAPKTFTFASEKHIVRKFLERNSLKSDICQLLPNNGLLINLDKPKELRFFLVGHNAMTITKNELVFSIGEISSENIKEQSFFNYSAKNNIKKLRKHDFNYEKIYTLRRCTRCILPATMPFITFDKEGVCNYCLNHKKIQYQGNKSLENLISSYRKSKSNIDCIVAFSGGRDSSYGLHHVKRILKMNPIAYTYDWGLVTDLARRNQARIVGKLGVEHIIVSADITLKRNNIRKNILAWLKKPDLGMIPLFTVGDKQAEFYIDQVAKRTGTDLIIYCSGCELENDDFKASYCGVKNGSPGGILHNLSFIGRTKMAIYYGRQFLLNPQYFNSSIFDTAFAYFSTYIKRHKYIYFWHYIPWNEQKIVVGNSRVSNIVEKIKH